MSKNQQWLLRERARILDLIEGTEIKEWECVKYCGRVRNANCDYSSPPPDYEFAVGLIEGKPAFADTRVYHKDHPEGKVLGLPYIGAYTWGRPTAEWSLTPPAVERTITINGETFKVPNVPLLDLRFDLPSTSADGLKVGVLLSALLKAING